jgi:hypothetical protein
LEHVYHSKNGNNWVDLSNIPLKKRGDKFIYDWRNCTRWIEISFMYHGLKDIMMLKYESTDENGNYYVKISYECCSIIIQTRSLQRGSLGGLLSKIPIKYPYLLKYFKNGFQEAKEYASGSNYKHELHCVNCGFEKQMIISNFTKQGFTCPNCSSNISFPERFTSSLLDEMGFDYETQKRFESRKWRFDFYVPYLELVIEVHGIQHFKSVWNTKDEIIRNDNVKRKFIKFELGLNYAAIDISVSEPYYAWGMLEQNDFLEPYMRDVNYDKVVERCNDLMLSKDHKSIIRDYKRGMRLIELSIKYETNRTTLKKRLLRNGIYKIGKIKGSSRAVICITTDEQFESITQAGIEFNLCKESIIMCCQGKRKSAGRTPDGRKRVWMYLEEYEKKYGKVDESLTG